MTADGKFREYFPGGRYSHSKICGHWGLNSSAIICYKNPKSGILCSKFHGYVIIGTIPVLCPDGIVKQLHYDKSYKGIRAGAVGKGKLVYCGEDCGTGNIFVYSQFDAFISIFLV